MTGWKSGSARRTARPRSPRHPRPRACRSSRCIVHKMHAGGGFGRRGPHQEYTKQAVWIAQSMPGTPVRLQWSREEDMQQGRYRPVALVKLRAGAGRAGQLDRLARAAGRPVDLDHGAADRHQERHRSGQRALLPGQSVRGAELHRRVRDAQYACAAGLLARGGAHQQSVLPRVLHRRAGACRRQGSRTSSAVRMLQKKQKDLGVLDAVAKAVGWGTPAPKGVHRGIAVVGFLRQLSPPRWSSSSVQGRQRDRREARDRGDRLAATSCIAMR